MNRIIVFILGLISGIAIMLILFFITNLFSLKDLIKESKDIAKEYVNEETELEEDFNEDKLTNIQYVELTGKNGDVTLHTYMPKDSVKLLIGKPTRISLMTIGNENHETWEYDYPGEDRYGVTSHLWLEFVNGKLDLIHEIN